MKKLALLLGVVSLILAAVGCSAAAAGTGSPQETNITINADQFNLNKNIKNTLEVKAGNNITVTLAANASTGFAWSQPLITDSNIIELVKSENAAPEGGMVGAPGNQVMVFKALKAGTVQITNQYDRPWQGGEKGVWSFKLDITVK